MNNKLQSLLLIAWLISLKLACGAYDSASNLKKTIEVKKSNRQNLLKTMDIWNPVDTENLDLFKGPTSHYEFGETIYCTFKEPEEGDFGSGLNQKFYCIDKTTNEELKVKYDIRNAEVYGEIAFSRLMYALGFNHDNYYSVRVECDNCPKDPWDYIQGYKPPSRRGENKPDPEGERGYYTFLPALVEVKTDGNKIENVEDQGVSWEEFNDYEGLTLEQKTIRDAFVLLMAFTHHADSKPDQQRLSCEKSATTKTDGKYICEKAKFLVHDGGWSFGAGVEPSINSMRAKMNRKFWTHYPVFKNKSTCKIGVRKLLNSEFENKEISENGRKFLADLLSRLSRKQIKDIFRASRVDLRDQVLYKESPEESLNKWADAFEKRRKEITDITCPKAL